MTVLIAEGMADAGIRAFRAAGATVVRSDEPYDPVSIHAMVVRSVFRVDAATLRRFPMLRVVAKLGTGLDNIDCDVCERAGVRVVSAPGVNSVSTAEFTVMQVLALWKNAYEIRDRVRARDYRRLEYHGRELAAATAGVIGYGSIGKHVVERLRPFVRQVVVFDRAQASRCTIDVGNVRFATTLDAVLPASDICILAITLAGNEYMVDAAFLQRVRPDVLLVNMARGGLIEESALVAFLRQHPTARYAADVVTDEPDYTLPPERQPWHHALLDLPNVTFTPHIASLTPECQEAIAVAVAEEVIGVLSAAPQRARPPSTMPQFANT